MTLRDKFEQWFINDEDEHYEGMVETVAIEHEKIAEELAIEFGNWLNNKVLSPKGTHHNLKNVTRVTQLFPIFKKEKGL